MKQATPQRTVTISVSGRTEEDARVSYSYWSPNDGLMRANTPVCDLYQKYSTNTLFVLDYASTQDGWTITGIAPNPSGAPALESIRGPKLTSIMTMFVESEQPELYKFFILYKNTITGASLAVDPQEGNTPLPPMAGLEVALMPQEGNTPLPPGADPVPENPSLA